MPGISKSPTLSWEALSVYWSVLQHLIRQFMALSLHFLLVQSLKVSPVWVLKAVSGLSWAFTQPWVCAQLCISTWSFTFPGMYWSSSNPLQTSHFPAFPFKLWVNVFFTPTVVYYSGSYTVKQLILTVLTYSFEENAFHVGHTLIQAKQRHLGNWNLLAMSKNGSSLEVGLWGSSSLVLSRPFLWLPACWFPLWLQAVGF